MLPTDDRDTVRAIGRRMIAEYLNVPVYAAFHEWIGRGDVLRPMWDAWKAGDRAGATEAIPDEVLDELIVWGSPEQCAEGVRRYADNGVTTPAPMIIADPPTAKTVDAGAGAEAQSRSHRVAAPRPASTLLLRAAEDPLRLALDALVLVLREVATRALALGPAHELIA